MTKQTAEMQYTSDEALYFKKSVKENVHYEEIQSSEKPVKLTALVRLFIPVPRSTPFFW